MRIGRPAIERLPAVRPRCPWCDRPLKPVTLDLHVKGYYGHIARRLFERWYGPMGIFDRVACAVNFATESYRAGYRRKGTT